MFKKKPFIIAEIASAHDGNYKSAKKIADQALKNGATALVMGRSLTGNIKKNIHKLIKELN